jgi:DNA-directed RNA polymerase subunit RPC12/RpoP
MFEIDKGALDRWIESPQRHQETGKWECFECGRKFEQEVTIEYGGVADDLECPICGSRDIEAEV